MLSDEQAQDRLDVGIDATGLMSPISLEEVMEKLEV